MATLSCEIDLPCARFVVAISSDSISRADEVELRGGYISSDLPPGMSVDFAHALILEAKPEPRLRDIRYSIRFAAPVVKGSPESGEWLDAMSFISRETTIMIGTEDGEMLSQRYPWIEIHRAYPVGYLKDGFEIEIPSIPPNAAYSLHFVVAAKSGVDDDSGWFAVDVPHNRLASLPLESIRMSLAN